MKHCTGPLPAPLFFVACLFARAVSLPIVMTADPGYYSGTPEGYFILQNMTDTTNTTEKVGYCAEVIEGTLRGKQMALVTTGIGHDNAAACTVAMLSYFKASGRSIDEVIYLGTSGWTPRVGGFFNPQSDPSCANLPDTVETGLVGIGDTCISPHTVLQGCGFCSWPTGDKGECAVPACTLHNETSVFSQCDFRATDTELAEGLLTAARSASFPAKPAPLSSFSDTYWLAMWKGLNQLSTATPKTAPTFYGGDTCAEAAGYTLWKGVPQDWQCRQYTASLVGSDAGAVPCVSAMEGPGWIRVLLDRHTAITNGKPVPFANVRAASNYVFNPLYWKGHVLTQNSSFLSSDDMQQFEKLGYRYAIQVGSEVVLAHYNPPPPPPLSS